MNRAHLIAAGLLVVGIGGVAVALAGGSPTGDLTREELDSFAQCLTENNATFYGSFRCGHCADQKAMFGDAMQYIDYVECHPDGPQAQPRMCREKNIRGTPTWIIGDERYTGTQTLQDLAQATGCTLPR
ncbi:MAG: hypothetical protein SVW77_03845 [Candidatus Nanohaloarchaea archaeon]|nr:hypothetical protein [Candidatus Nanohaloarchaea archaeon]